MYFRDIRIIINESYRFQRIYNRHHHQPPIPIGSPFLPMKSIYTHIYIYTIIPYMI